MRALLFGFCIRAPDLGNVPIPQTEAVRQMQAQLSKRCNPDDKNLTDAQVPLLCLLCWSGLRKAPLAWDDGSWVLALLWMDDAALHDFSKATNDHDKENDHESDHADDKGWVKIPHYSGSGA